MVPAMARALDNCPRRIYKSLAGPKPTRKIVVVTNPYRFQSKLSQAFCKTLLAHSRTLHPGG
jgi:LysR family hydrogen peroxide-inducible transcriptional activator